MSRLIPFPMPIAPKSSGLALQAAIKLKHWTDALRAADEALEIDDEAGNGRLLD